VTLDARAFRIQFQQRIEITLPARVQPINDKSYLVEIVRQKHRTIFL
jgi:hypothetical protein